MAADRQAPAGDSPPHPRHAITVSRVTKSYRRPERWTNWLRRWRRGPDVGEPEPGEVPALRDVSVEIQADEHVALLGLNGAGKSTLIKILCGVMGPTSGEVRVLGRDPVRDRVAHSRRLGAMFGQRTQLWWELPALDSLRMLAEMHQLPRAVAQSRLAELDSQLGISEFWRLPARRLSLGQRVRCDLAAALLHDPAVLLLDEPTIGMDVLTKDRVRETLVRRRRRGGGILLLTTHDMADVAELCDRILLLDRGELVFDGTVARFLAGARYPVRLRITTTAAGAPPPEVDCPVIARPDERTYVFGISDRSRLAHVVGAVAGHPAVATFGVAEVTIEDVIRSRHQAPAEEGLAWR